MARWHDGGLTWAPTTGRAVEPRHRQLSVREDGVADVDARAALSVDADGKPTDTILATATLANGAVSPGAMTSVTFEFSRPFPLTAGSPYALVLSRSNGNTFQWGQSPGDCAGLAWVRSGEAGWVQQGIHLVFTIYVRA